MGDQRNLSVKGEITFTSVLAASETEAATGFTTQAPCHEVDGFGHYCFLPVAVPPQQLRDWPPLWATALVDEVDSIFHLAAVYATPEAAHADAQCMAMKLVKDQQTRRRKFVETINAADVAIAEQHTELERFDYQIKQETVLHGRLTDEGLLTLAPHDDAWSVEDVLQIQAETGYNILLATERALRSLPKEARQLIYAQAYTARSIQSPAVHPACTRLLVKAMNTPKGPFGFYINTQWIMDLQWHATINDLTRAIYSKLWRVNAARPLGERVPDEHVRSLWLRLSIELHVFAHATSRYVSGAQRVNRFTDQLLQQAGLPQLIVCVE